MTKYHSYYIEGAWKVKKFSLVIADEKESNKSLLKTLLKDHPNFEAIALAFDWQEAIRITQTMQADVLFINSNLIPNNETIETLAKECPDYTQIVYLGESEADAIYAFEHDFVDYILFPCDGTRFEKCINKLSARLNKQPEVPLNNIQALISQLNQPEQTLIVKDSGRIKLIDCNEIIWIGGAGNYVELYLENEERPVLHRETLATMESNLANIGFIRIHRSILVRKKFISELKPTDSGDYQVTLRNGHQLSLSRRYKSAMTGII